MTALASSGPFEDKYTGSVDFRKMHNSKWTKGICGDKLHSKSSTSSDLVSVSRKSLTSIVRDRKW